MTKTGHKSRLKRRLWQVTGLLVLVLAGTGYWFYNFYFASTEAAIRHAEAFLFRRMTVAQLAEQGQYRFFYVTNRNQGADDAPFAERFGSEREDELKFGTFDAAIRPSLGLGMFINPTEWFQNEEIQLQNVDSAEQAEFVAQLRKQVEASPHRGLLVLVNGFREAYKSALGKTAFVGHVLDINSPVMLFDWPGNQGSSLRGYRSARAVAKASGAELAATLQLIVEEVQPERLWLIANSMGGEVVAHAFSRLYRDPAWADTQVEIEDVVLTAPDVSHEVFNQQFKLEISALTKNLTVYVSSNDRALIVSRLINRDIRLGESTLGSDQLSEAVGVAGLVDPGSDLVRLVDVTPVNRTRNFHNFSLETPEFFDDLYLRLMNRETPSSRPIYKVQTSEGSVYEVLTRGR